MSLPPPMHYAVTMALQDAIAALDAGQAASITSGALTSLKVRRGVLEAALSRGGGTLDGHAAAKAELAVIVRMLDALAGART